VTDKRPPPKRSKTPPPPPSPSKEQPLIRIALNPDDMVRLLDRLGEWNDPLLHRLRMRYTAHRLRYPG